MDNQDSAKKMGQNWQTVALVAAVLLVGAVMGHSLLTGDQADDQGKAAKTACQSCPSKQTCASQAAAPTEAVFASQAEGSCCAGSETAEEAGCCAQKSAGCASAEAGCQAKSGCGGGCSSSTDTQ